MSEEQLPLYELQVSNEEAHLQGRFHHEAAPARYVCDLCRVCVDSEVSWNAHLKGKYHQSAMRRRAVAGSEYFCDICNVHTNGEASMQDHLRGKHHLAKTRPLREYVCKLCNVHVTSEDSLQDHFRGRPHQKVARMAAATERTIFVRGFPPEEVQEEDLKQLFLEFGEVTSVSLDMAKKLFAFVEFADSDSALKALQHPYPLFLYAKRLVLKPREQKPREPTPSKKKMAAAAKESAKVQPRHDPPDESPSIPAAIGGILFPPGTVEELELANTMEEEIEILSSHCRMPDAAIEKQFSLCQLLQSALRRVFPHCIVVLFGAPISGFATLTSDCDVSLLPDPTEDDRRLLTGREYYSEKHLAMWGRVAMATPSPPTECDPETGGSPITVSTSYSKRSPHCTLEYDIALKVIRKLPTCSRIRPIAFARCPIIRLFHSPTGIHCDLSINNRLGPYNTRLMRAYCDFDSRVVQLVIVLRMWVRSIGLSRAQFNNYALSQLLIYALQRASVPVLPCLQVPGSWPKNMEWFAAQGFAGAVNSTAPVVVGGWRCDFTPPASLLPSNNNTSVAELLLHFFRFYTEQFEFGEEVVAIHCNPSTKLNVQLAINLMKRGMNSSDPKSPFFRVSPLCIQDPFDLSHNVTKSLNQSSFISLKQKLRNSWLVLREQLQIQQECAHPSSLLPLFGSEHMKADVHRKTSSNLRILMFPPNKLSSLFEKVDAFRPLANRLHELDLSNSEVTRKLSLGVLKAIVVILQQDLGFSCTATPEHVHTHSQPGDSSKQPVGDVAPQELGKGLCEATPQEEEMEVVSYDSKQPQEPSAEEPPEATVPRVEEEMVSEETDDTSRKRQRSSQDEQVGETSKRAKVSTVTPALDMLRSALGEEQRIPNVYICTAYFNTWVHRRAYCRQQERSDSTDSDLAASLGSLGQSLPEVAPLLQFSLSVTMETQPQGGTVPENMVPAITLAPCSSHYASEFSTFFAFFKKLVTHKQIP